jgi:hypothetical protein
MSTNQGRGSRTVRRSVSHNWSGSVVGRIGVWRERHDQDPRGASQSTIRSVC